MRVLTRNCYSFWDGSQVIVRNSDNRSKATSCDFCNAARHECVGCDLYWASIFTRRWLSPLRRVWLVCSQRACSLLATRSFRLSHYLLAAQFCTLVIGFAQEHDCCARCALVFAVVSFMSFISQLWTCTRDIAWAWKLCSGGSIPHSEPRAQGSSLENSRAHVCSAS